MLSNIPFGHKFIVSTTQNEPKAFKQFEAYCKVRSALTGKTLYEVKHGKSFSDIACTLDVQDKISPKVEEYCRMNGINYSKTK